MKRILMLCLLFITLSAYSYSVDRPKLVVGIVIDQMRWDYLYRYYDRYSEDGFKLLLNKGFNCQNTMINYIPSYTAVGHASIYTGSVPSINGIAGNYMIDQASGKLLYCVEDSTVESVGVKNSQAGKMSPRNLMVTTITDELKLATNFRSKVVSISLKDRSSILPAGHSADAAFWFDENTGDWISSSWYMDKLPKWVVKHNKSGKTKNKVYEVWKTKYPISSYEQSAPEGNNYEIPYNDDLSTISFPIDYAKLFKSADMGYSLIKDSYIGNEVTLNMAREALENYSMGEDDITDFLAISLSSTDYIGHRYSPNSIKVEDSYLKLDSILAQFIKYLDNRIGKDEYLLFITADHGGGHNAKFLLDNKIPAEIWDYNASCDSLNDYLYSIYNKRDIVISLNNYQVNFDYSKISGHHEKQKIIDDCISYFLDKSYILYAIDMNNISNTPVPEIIREKVVNGYNNRFSGEVQLILKPHYYSHSKWQGATHGAWNPYDAHIPLIFYGKGIPQGETSREYFMTDIAATLAYILKIQMPSGSIGKTIQFK